MRIARAEYYSWKGYIIPVGSNTSEVSKQRQTEMIQAKLVFGYRKPELQVYLPVRAFGIRNRKELAGVSWKNL